MNIGDDYLIECFERALEALESIAANTKQVEDAPDSWLDKNIANMTPEARKVFDEERAKLLAQIAVDNPEDAPGGPWRSENIGDADRNWGPTVWDSRCVGSVYGVTGTSRFYFATLPLAEAVRDVLNRDFLNRLKGEET